mgnify:CR=1 FL=1
MYQIKWIINIYMILSNYARGILLIALNLFKKKWGPTLPSFVHLHAVTIRAMIFIRQTP